MRMRQSFLSIVWTSLVMCSSVNALGDGAVIHIDASQPGRPVSRYLTGACIEDVNHEIYGGIYSQMIFGESFQEPAPSPEIKNFKAFGGRWIVRDGAVTIDAGDAPKLVSDHAAMGDGAIG